MKCCENVIVTVRLHPGDRSLDMELPSFLPVSQLGEKFLETVQEMDPLHYGTVSTVIFRRNSHELDGEMTLAQAGIWDGAVLDADLT